jgi:class 3 adenylate cyclase
VDIPEVRYATTSDGVSIAYQVVGASPPDLVFINAPYISNIELVWEWPPAASLLRGLAARGRLILFDRRGTGLSDKVSADRFPTLEARMDDIRAVMDAAGTERAILAGVEDGAALCFLFAATYPDRVAALIAYQGASRGSWAPDAPWLLTEEAWEEWFQHVERDWGTREFVHGLVEETFPSRLGDAEFIRGYWRLVRQSITKSDMVAVDRMWKDTDVRDVLPTIQAPTLVTFTQAIHDVPGAADESRYVASRIPGAVLAETETTDVDIAFALPSIDQFLASLRAEEAQFDRVLATVMFTDIVGSTTKAAELGDRAWGEVVEQHHATVRAMLGRYRGMEVDTAGDGFFATFDGPARAVRCARSIVEAVRPLGIDIRAGVHTGEVETIDGKVGGIAVAIGSRIGGFAGAAEVWASSTVKDLTAGSGLVFEDAGEHELNGVPDRWHLYRVIA